MKSPASANAENSSKQKRGEWLKNRRKIAVVCLVILGILLAVSYLFLSQLASIALSAFLKKKVNVGSADIRHGLRLRNVSIYDGGLFLNVEEVLLDVKFDFTGRAAIKRVILNKPVLCLSSAGLRSISGFSSPITLPSVIVNEGTLILKDGFCPLSTRKEIVDINYLKFNGFVTETGFYASIFGDLGLRNKKVPVKFRGEAFIVGNIRESKMYTRIYSSDFQLGNFEFRDLSTSIKLNRNKFSMTEISAVLFNGLLNGWVQADLDSKEYLFGCELAGLNLKELMRSLNLKKKDIRGALDMRLKLSANAEGWRSLHGSGSVKIRDGQLWEVPVLYGLRTLMLKSAFKGAVFKNGGCDFKISEGILHTKNLRLMSGDVGLAAEGSLSFDGKLDFLVTTVFTDEFMDKTSEMLKITSLLSEILDFFIAQYHIGGTLSDPSYELIPLPVIVAIPLQIKRILGILFPGKNP